MLRRPRSGRRLFCNGRFSRRYGIKPATFGDGGAPVKGPTHHSYLGKLSCCAEWVLNGGMRVL